MRQPAPSCGAPFRRLAWCASCLLTVALIAAFGLLRAAQASAASSPAPGADAGLLLSATPQELTEQAEAREEEEEEEELEAEECEAGEAAEECEEVEETAPKCPLSEAEASVTAAHGKLRLLIRYDAVEPIALTVSTWSRGTHGPFHLAPQHTRFAQHGAFRQTAALSVPQRLKVDAARAFVVQLRLASAPRECSLALERRLTSRHAAHARLTWSEPK